MDLPVMTVRLGLLFSFHLFPFPPFLYYCTMDTLPSLLVMVLSWTYSLIPRLGQDALWTVCYTQALGVVVVRSLSVELLGRIETRNGRPSCHVTQGQNHGVRRGCRGSGSQAIGLRTRGFHKEGESVVRGFRRNSLVLVQKIKPKA